VSATGEEDHVSKENGARCTHCGSPSVRRKHVRSAFWHDERLVVVEDLPAIVCGACHEQFYDDQTMVVLDLMRGDGFPAEKARRELRVPVFSFQDRLAPQSAQ
jgi:YgiT-type zinc finger domain-containing protein